MVFRPYPQVIRCFFNNNRFGPPPRVTGGSACPGIDHPASGLPWRTRRALRTRLRFGSAIRLNLARHGNSQAHYAKGMRSPLRAPTVWRRMVSGSVSLPSKGFFSPFPRGTRALSVGRTYSALWNGLHGFGRGFTCPALLGIRPRDPKLRARGSHPLRPAFPGRCARILSRSCRPATPPGKPGGLGSSAFARHYLRNLC